MGVLGRDEGERPPLIVVCNGVEYMRIEPPPSETDEARGITVVPLTDHRGAVGDAERLREWLRFIAASNDDDDNIAASVELALDGQPVEWGR